MGGSVAAAPGARRVDHAATATAAQATRDGTRTNGSRRRAPLCAPEAGCFRRADSVPSRQAESRIHQRVGERLRRLEAVCRQLLQRLGHGCSDVGRHGFPHLLHRPRLVGDDPHDDLLRRRPRVRRVPREHLVQHARQRVHVRASGEILVRRRLLRAHVVRGPQAHPRFGHPPPRRGAHRQRDPEVRHHRAAVVQQDVLRLDVPVDHPVPVRVVQRVRHLPGDAHSLLHPQLCLPVQLVAERLAFDVRHHVEQEAVGGPRVEERKNMRVLKLRGCGDLLHEALGAQDGSQLGLQDLDGHLPVVAEIFREVDRGHAALAELGVHRVPPPEGGVEAGDAIRHQAGTASVILCARPPNVSHVRPRGPRSIGTLGGWRDSPQASAPPERVASEEAARVGPPSSRVAASVPIPSHLEEAATTAARAALSQSSRYLPAGTSRSSSSNQSRTMSRPTASDPSCSTIRKRPSGPTS